MRLLTLFYPCLLALSLTAFSQSNGGNDQGPGKMPMGMGGPMEEGRPPHEMEKSDNSPAVMLNIVELRKLMSEININNEIASKITGIARNFQSFLDGQILKIQREEINVKEELLKQKPDLQKIQAVVNRKTQLFGEIEFAQIKRDLEIKSLLTQDEYDRWKEAMMRKMREMRPAFIEKPWKNSPDDNVKK